MDRENTVRLAESLAFVLFNLGVVGIGVVLLVAMSTGPEHAGRAWLMTWAVAALALAVSGAMIGALAEAAAPRSARSRTRATPLDAPRTSAPAPRAEARPARPAVSAFRAVARP